MITVLCHSTRYWMHNELQQTPRSRFSMPSCHLCSNFGESNQRVLYSEDSEDVRGAGLFWSSCRAKATK